MQFDKVGYLRENAEKCLRKADAAPDEALRSIWLGVAVSWHTHAEHAARAAECSEAGAHPTYMTDEEFRFWADQINDRADQVLHQVSGISSHGPS